MLVVFTKYDKATEILDQCARHFLTKAQSRVSVTLGPPESEASKVQAALEKQQNAALFFFGHGTSPVGLIGQDKLPALHAGNLELLADRIVCATACFSWDILSHAAGEHNFTVLGYRGVLNLPVDCKYHARFFQCVLEGPLQLLGGQSTTVAHAKGMAAFEQEATELIRGSVMDGIMASLVFRKAAVAIQLGGSERTL